MKCVIRDTLDEMKILEKKALFLMGFFFINYCININ